MASTIPQQHSLSAPEVIPMEMLPQQELSAESSDTICIAKLDSIHADSMASIQMTQLHPYVAAPMADTLDIGTLRFCPNCFVEPTMSGMPLEHNSVDSSSNTIDTIITHNSLFAGHELQVVNDAPLPRSANHTDGWMTVGTILLAITAYLYLYSHRLKITQVIKAIFSQSYFEFIQREKMMHHAIHFLTPTILCAITLAFYSLALHQTYPETNSISAAWEVLLLAIGGFLLLVIRNGLIVFLGQVFDNRTATSRHIRISQLCQLMLSIVMMPLLLLRYSMHLTAELYIQLISIPIAIILLIDFIRGVLIILTHPQKTNFYLIFYLCSVEIGPAIVLAKMFISQ
ncbi:MAG: DUF4271 domain-containing protein [Bacteroidales bacterium]|nr:DUF4271 domain-containing protein [Bacteroidales bacterium]